MRRGTGLFVLVVMTAILALGTTHGPEALADAELFRVTRVNVEGARYLSEAEALETARVPTDASLWVDTGPMLDRLRGHPLVREVRVRRRLPGTLVLEVVERQPVALLPMPTLRPVDRDGRLLPIDPALHRLDLPLLEARSGAGASSLSPAELRTLAGELDRLEALDPLVLASVSDAAIGPWGEVVLRLAEPRVTFLYSPPLNPTRLRQGLLALADALERSPDRPPTTVDLRFADQVVVGVPSSGPRGR
jgi:cell division septal protein FtsQ